MGLAVAVTLLTLLIIWTEVFMFTGWMECVVSRVELFCFIQFPNLPPPPRPITRSITLFAADPDSGRHAPCGRSSPLDNAVHHYGGVCGTLQDTGFL